MSFEWISKEENDDEKNPNGIALLDIFLQDFGRRKKKKKKGVFKSWFL